MYQKEVSLSNDVAEEYITTEFGSEFKKYCIVTRSSDFHKLPGWAEETSDLHKWKLLHCPNELVMQYIQNRGKHHFSRILCAYSLLFCFFDHAKYVDENCFIWNFFLYQGSNYFGMYEF